MTEEILSENEILRIRNSVDAISWTLLDIAKDEGDRLLRIDYLNKFLIESFNWFTGEGLTSFFENREIEIPEIGVIKITDHRLDFPRKDELGDANSLLWPNEARVKGLNYWGYLMVKATITWDKKSGRSAEGTVPILDSGNEYIPIGKIPIMLGSKHDNLTTLNTREEVVKHEECDRDFLGYFITNGNEKVLISQNFLKQNVPICTVGKIRASLTAPPKLKCSIRSKGSDWYISQHTVFIMKSHSNKTKHSDRRLYVDMSNIIKRNIYDSIETIIGINIVSLFRLSIILMHRFDPTLEEDAYLFATVPANPRLKIPEKIEGFRGQSTYKPSIELFMDIMKNHAGDKLWSRIEDYIVDTVNEASLEQDEHDFLDKTVRISMDLTKDGKISLSTAASRAIVLFAKSFMPHCSRTNFWTQLKRISALKTQVNNEIKTIHSINTRELMKDRNAVRDSLMLLNHVYENFSVGKTEEDVILAKVIAALEKRNIYILKTIDPRTKRFVIRAFSSQQNIVDLKRFREQSQIVLAPINRPTTITDNSILLARAFSLFEQQDFGTIEYININKVLLSRNIILLQNYLFGQKEFVSIRSDIISRLNVLAHMAIRVLRIELGFDNLDDRDSLAIQKFEQAGLLMMTRFSSMFRSYEKMLIGKIPKGSNLITIVTDMKKYGESIISKEYSSNFSTGKWNAKNSKKERTGVTDILPTTVTIARLAFLRRLSAQSNDNSKNTAARDITGLQGGAVCISETPEGKQCGNVENLATAAYITNDSFDPTTIAFKLHQLKTSRRHEAQPLNKDTTFNGVSMLAARGLISNLRSLDKDTPLFLNGKFIGWVHGLSFRKLLIQMRRHGLLHPHTGVVFKQNLSQVGPIRELKIETSGGRIVQPLIIAEEPEKVVKFLMRLLSESIKETSLTIETLIEEGLVEYVDSGELEFLDIAPSVDVYLNMFNEGLGERYDHIMLNPAFLMGISANVMPFANMNPVVRNSYFTAQVKQPIIMGAPTIAERTFKTASRFQSPQHPLIKTKMYDHVLQDDPFGINVDILITPHKFGEEDGIVVNREFLDLGGFASTSYTTFTMNVSADEQLLFEDEFMEKVEEPDRYGRGVIRIKRKEVVIDENGNEKIIVKPIIVKPHEVLARKTKFAEGIQTSEVLKFDSLREGVVERILWNKSSKITHTLAVIVRMEDRPWIGDKLSSRFAQKGIITLVVPPEDMPFDTETGKRADLIINPQALPSRMTVGQIAELFAANAFILPDKLKIVHILYRNRGLDIFAPLERLFIVDKDDWDVYNLEKSPETPSRVRPKLTRELNVVVSSETATDQETMDWLKKNDLVTKFKPFSKGLWGIKVLLGTRNKPNTKISKYIFVLDKNQNLEDLDVIPATWMKERKINVMKVDDENVGQIKVENIPGLWFDTETFDPEDDDTEFINPLQGIRLSTFPEELKNLYIRGNGLLPVADQYIIDYRESFFQASNLNMLFFDFIIPDNMLTLKVLNENQLGFRTISLPTGIKHSELQRSQEKYGTIVTKPVEIKGNPVIGDDGKAITEDVIVEMSLFALWTREYRQDSLIPKENVIRLPKKARDIFEMRKEHIDNLREATIFKKGVNVDDAMRELELMGYQSDGRRQFINGKTGELIRGGVVSGWTYYMALKHKVKNKMQARGHGRIHTLTHQPVAGRTHGGGMKFNLMDALASIKSGATAFVSDRLLDSSGRKDVFVCKECREVCYKEEQSKAIICPICRTGTKAVQISVPYIFLLERNLLMGAGIRLGIDTVLDNESHFPEEDF